MSAALADLLRALERLHPGDAETRLQIAGLLGFAPPAPELPGVRPPAHPPAVGAGELDEPAGEGGKEQAAAEDEDRIDERPPVRDSAAYHPAPPERERPFTLEQVRRASPAVPRWVFETEAVPRPAVPAGAAPPAPEPLLDPATTRAVLAAALSTVLPEGPLDLAALVRAAASGRAMDVVPHRPRRTLGRPVQLLVDRGEGMLPFRADVRQLAGRVRVVAGADRVTVLGFEGTPLRGAGEGSRRTWKPYRLPPPGTVVAAVTDLGAGRAGARGGGWAHPDEWLEVARLLRLSGIVLRAFVPYPLERIPAALRREVRVVTWDRGTGVRAVHALLAAPNAAPRP